MHKAISRKTMRERRYLLSAEEVQAASRIICQTITERYPDKKQIVLLYMPIQNEVDITPLLTYYERVYLPKTNGDTMCFLQYDGRLETGNFGVLEPIGEQELREEPALILVPGVAFDWHGNRVGYGKGYYDKFLQNRQGKTVGIAYDFQVVRHIEDAEATDVALSEIITERGIYTDGKKQEK